MDESIFTIVIIVATLSIVSALITMEIYKSKNRPALHGFALGFFLGIIGIVIALIMSSEITYRDRVASGEMKVCPQCRNLVLSSVNVCPKCGRNVSQVISRLADLGETREEKEAREREAAKRELILGGKIFLGLIVVAIIIAIVLTLAR